jgi:ethanolaminephosphotransferase
MGWANSSGLSYPWASLFTLDLLFQVLALFLLSTPHVLCRKAELDVPLLSPVFSLLFYLVFLVLSAIHVLVCTSSESSCYLCSLSWLAVGAVMLLVSALFCAILSALIRMVIDSTLLKKVYDVVLVGGLLFCFAS